MIVWKIDDHKFSEVLYPTENALLQYQFKLKANPETLSPETKGLVPPGTTVIDKNNLAIKVSSVHSIKENYYIIQSDVMMDGSPKHFLYAFVVGKSNASYVTDGLYQNMEVVRHTEKSAEILIFVLELYRQFRDPTVKFSGRIKALVLDGESFYYSGS